jgi:prevent-host-death family protein
MKRLNVSESRKSLPRLLAEISEDGEPVLVTRRGKPLAKIVPCTPEELGLEIDALPLRGLPFVMADDFDAPLDAEWEALAP